MFGFPDHPVVAAMERDGKLSRNGAFCECGSCGADICAGEKFYYVDGEAYCIGCQDEALRNYTHTAPFPD